MDIKGSFESLNAEYYEHLESENILQFKTLLGRNIETDLIQITQIFCNACIEFKNYSKTPKFHEYFRKITRI